ncbi:MAG TPA: TMEM14 family protein [Chthoniobacteraceae bacterium]|jgi:uncharacterized membrane protein (UPF0136 family)|nr:TMEM14 family protein [Chthoniobacteraceae bacterium]
MIQLTKYYYYLFGLLTIAGGIMGYVTKHSHPSLIAGSISGALLIFAGVLVATRVQPALILGGLISLVLAFIFVRKLMNDGGFMPAGLMTGLSLIGAVLTAITLLAPREKR